MAAPLPRHIVRRKLETATARDFAAFGRLSDGARGCYCHRPLLRYWCGLCLHEMFGPGPAYCRHCEIEWGAPERTATDQDYAIWLAITVSRRDRALRDTATRAWPFALLAVVIAVLAAPLVVPLPDFTAAGLWLATVLVLLLPLDRAVDRRNARIAAKQELCEGWQRERQALEDAWQSPVLVSLQGKRSLPAFTTYEEWPQSDLGADPLVLLAELRQREAIREDRERAARTASSQAAASRRRPKRT